MIKKLFFCENCRTQIDDVSQIHFVEDHSDRGFCSEKCILQFYRPYMELMEQEEFQFRSQLGLPPEEGHNELLAQNHYIQLALNSPTEIWQVENDLGQKFYTHILEIRVGGQDVFMILLCSYIDGSPSFVFYRTITMHKDLVDLYRRDVEVEIDEIDEADISEMDQKMQITQDVMEQIEFKKSTLLADMLLKREPNDISFERFSDYDDYMEETLTDPDEVYEYEDEEGDIIHTCIKSYQKDSSSFFYILLALPFRESANSKEIVMIPILGFPSNDKNLYPKYATGKRLDEALKN